MKHAKRGLTVLACACVLGSVLWALGQITRDRWVWSQILYWIPAPLAAVSAAVGFVLLWRLQTRVARWAAAVTMALLCAALVSTLRTDIGWGSSETPANAESVRVVHWNPRAPGMRAIEFGRALAQVHADVYVISNPGHMARPSIAQHWVPEGWSIRDCGPMALVTRLPIESARVLAFAPLPIETGMWMVAIELSAPGGRTLRILAVDLPSAIRLPRTEVAKLAGNYLNLYPGLHSPDVLLGDFNNLPDSVIFESLPPTRSPSATEAHGWLGTFPRGFPLWRIDGMRVNAQWTFERYETIDLGVALHRAQLGVVAPKAAPTPFPPHHEE